MTNAIRSLLGVVAGILLISLIAESIEFGLVSFVHGSTVTDPEVYFGIRNRPGMLLAKLVYNNGAAVLGGHVAAWIAGRAHLAHGAVVAVLQVGFLVWGMTLSEFAGTTPAYAWVTLAVTMFVAILYGAWLRSKRG